MFEAPTNFVANLSRISQEHLHKVDQCSLLAFKTHAVKMFSSVHYVKEDGEVPVGASVPSLGLSNKAVFAC